MSDLSLTRDVAIDFFESRVSSYQKANVSRSDVPKGVRGEAAEDQERLSRRVFRMDADF